MNAAACSFTRRQALGALAAASASQSAWGQGIRVPDTVLLNHDGQRVRLRQDVWRDRLAVVNFIFTTCSSFCGLQSAMLAQWQARLGQRLGKEVVFISLSVDPLNDDALRLQVFSRPFQPGPHWWWLTGEPSAVFSTLKALGADAGAPGDHAPQWLLGRAQAPRRVLGFPSLAQLELALKEAAK